LGSLYSNKFFKIEESDDFLDIAFYQNWIKEINIII
jgi:hypothetical protein